MKLNSEFVGKVDGKLGEVVNGVVGWEDFISDAVTLPCAGRIVGGEVEVEGCWNCWNTAGEPGRMATAGDVCC